MYIDVIVPNFDESADSVLISSWYKKVGEKISNGEVIADAETSTVACAITSGYDCFLSKILVREGETVSQGAKIAIIEVDVDKPSVDPKKEDDIKHARKELADLSIGFTNPDNSSKREYTLTANVASEIAEKVTEASENIQEEEREIVQNIIEDGASVDSEVMDTFTEHAEEQFKTILKDAEIKAKNEAEKLRNQILNEAEIQATAKGEELKKKILKEYEEKATKSASEMHDKIIQGTISEAENTKNRLIQEAENSAREEAEILKTRIRDSAEQEAMQEANILRDTLRKEAEKKAREEAEKHSKEIIERAISESKVEAKEIKKEIIRSASRHAKKESQHLIKENIKHAYMEAQYKVDEIIVNTTNEAKKMARDVRDEILQRTKDNVKEIIDGMTHSILVESQIELDRYMDNFVENKQTLEDELRKELSKQIHINLDELIHAVVSSIAFESSKEIREHIDAFWSGKNLLFGEGSGECCCSGNSEICAAHEILAERFKAREDIKNLKDDLVSIINLEHRRQYEENLKLMNEIQILKEGLAEAIGVEQNRQFSENAEIRNVVCRLRDEIKAMIDSEYQKSFEECLELRNDIRNLERDVKKIANAAQEARQIEQLEIENEVNQIKENVANLAKQEEEKAKEDVANLIKRESKKAADEDTIMRLLNIAEADGSPEMYADNWGKPKFFYSPDDQTETLDFLKQRISDKMKEAYDSSVISTVSNEVDMTAVLSIEKTFGQAFAAKHNTRLGFTPFFIMAVVEALKRYKVFNAHIHDNEIIYKKDLDISIITCGNDGIFAPVIRQADKLSFAEIEKRMITLSRRAIEGTLSLEEVSNGTFTVVNAGIYGSLMGTDILTPPQVATLSVHKMHNRPIATDDGVEIRPMLYVSLSYDHRIADTKIAAEFLSNVKNYVENPGYQLLGL